MQAKRHSLYEALANTAVGILAAVTITQLLSMFGPSVGLNIHVSFSSNIILTAFIVVAQIIRSYVLRRIFNRIALKRLP